MNCSAKLEKLKDRLVGLKSGSELKISVYNYIKTLISELEILRLNWKRYAMNKKIVKFTTTYAEYHKTRSIKYKNVLNYFFTTYLLLIINYDCILHTYTIYNIQLNLLQYRYSIFFIYWYIFTYFWKITHK